jgi:formylglycine-generating enzyme required for sulfatase activity
MMAQLSKLSLLGLLIVSAGCQQPAQTSVEINQASKADAADDARVTYQADTKGMVFIKGGTFEMGDDESMPHEGPAHWVTVDSFWMDATEVTVGEFARFVGETGYRTEAEKFGWSGVFDIRDRQWKNVKGATWRAPEGPGSTARPDEPVTQVSWHDANEYAQWSEKRLPTETEWEYAARGGLTGKTYAWGDDLRPHGKAVANWWQGRFPDLNTKEDGFTMRAPVGSFAPNDYGLYDVAGNVWEWCADWFDANYYAASPNLNPQGAAHGEERAMRGGSWMCAENFCVNYRVAARSSATPDTGLNNLGFRCVRSE